MKIVRFVNESIYQSIMLRYNPSLSFVMRVPNFKERPIFRTPILSNIFGLLATAANAKEKSSLLIS
jgi:hypothetical protein